MLPERFHSLMQLIVHFFVLLHLITDSFVVRSCVFHSDVRAVSYTLVLARASPCRMTEIQAPPANSGINPFEVGKFGSKL